jgi:tetratricopeptide (TPR) repeat protein
MEVNDAASRKLIGCGRQTGSENSDSTRTRCVRTLSAAFLCAVVLGGPTFAQTGLQTVQRFYDAAAYEEALAELDKVHPADQKEELGAAEYRILCLLALKDFEAAAVAVGRLLQGNPDYAPTARFSPRHRDQFETIKQRVLPPLVRQRYVQARANYFVRDYQHAVKDFQSVLALLHQVNDDSELREMRSLAAEFLQLAAIATKDVATPITTARPEVGNPVSLQHVLAIPVAATTTATGSDVSQTSAQHGVGTIYDLQSVDVIPPTPIEAILPPVPPSPSLLSPTTGLFEVVIDETGRVESVAVIRTIGPQSDALMMNDVRKWRFKPATRRDQPVKFRNLFEVYAVPLAALRR